MPDRSPGRQGEGPQVAVIIVGFRNPADVEQCLEALSRSSYKSFTVNVCENGGDDAFATLCAAIPGQLETGQTVAIHNAGANLGFAGGVNRGLSLAPKSDAYWILNPDTEPAPDALEHLVARFRKGDVSAVGGVVTFPSGKVQAFGGLWRGWLARPVSIGKGRDPGNVDPAEIERTQSYLLGASMFVGKDLLDTIGGMREDYFLYAEEIEWFIRARCAGLRLGFSPSARIIHAQGTTTGAGGGVKTRSPMSVYLDERNKLLVIRDTHPYRLVPAGVGALALLFIRFVRAGAWDQLASAFAGWFAGMKGERGKPSWVS